MWNIIVTLATVGYGDFFQKSFMGRIIGMIMCFWGTFVGSYFVVTVTNMMSLTTSEEKTYSLL
jgi:potassium intermediate/small conductance calcium-activated channel subfamily N protein 2